MTEAMNGMIMIARITPAVSTPIPIIGPLNNSDNPGTTPSVDSRNGWT